MNVTRRHRFLLVCCSYLALATLGCDRHETPHTASQSGASAKAQLIDYPSGPWWRGEINYTLLGLSHILVSYQGAKLEDHLMSVPGPAATRTREHALELAQEIALEAQKNPADFAKLARQLSDDARTAVDGGVLGAVFAPHLPKGVVDALGNLKVGEVSRVVESALGFHIVKRMQVAAERTVSANEIVIGYDSAQPARLGAAIESRSRAQALALAQRVHDLARENPASFVELVAKYSEAFDAQNHGFYGDWSTYARNGEPLVLHALEQLEPGEVSSVIDTPLGFRILQRLAPQPHERFGTKAILIGYHVDNSDLSKTVTRTREEARLLADRLLAELLAEPAKFDSLANSNCDFDSCNRGVFNVLEGWSNAGRLSLLLPKVDVGAVVPEVVETPGAFMIARREPPADPAATEATKVSLELPRPAQPTLDSAKPEELVWYMHQLRDAALGELELDAETAARFTQAMDDFTNAYASTAPDARNTLAKSAEAEFLAMLGPKQAMRLKQVNERLMVEVLGRTDSESEEIK